MKKKLEQDKYVKFHISLEPRLFSRLKKHLEKSGRNRSETIRNALDEYLKINK